MGTSHQRKGWPHPVIDLFINPCYHFLCLSAHISFVLEKKALVCNLATRLLDGVHLGSL